MEKYLTSLRKQLFQMHLVQTHRVLALLAAVSLSVSACTEKPSPQTLAEHAHDHAHIGHGIPHPNASSVHAKHSDALVEIRGYRFKLETNIDPPNAATHTHAPASIAQHHAAEHPTRMARFRLWVHSPQQTTVQNAQAVLLLSAASGARQTVPLQVLFPEKLSQNTTSSPKALATLDKTIDKRDKTETRILYQATTRLAESGRYAVTVQVSIDAEKYNPRFEFFCP